MKKAIISVFLTLGVMAGYGQLKVGAGGGLNFSNFHGSDVSFNEGLSGFNIGLLLEVKAPAKIGVEADILYSVKGAKYDYNWVAIDPNDPFLPQDGEQKMSYLDIPIVAKLYTAKVLSFQLGIQNSLLLGADYNGADNKDLFKGFDVSAVVGLGLDIKLIHFSCRYIYGLTGISDAGGDVKNGMLTLTAGIWLKK